MQAINLAGGDLPIDREIELLQKIEALVLEREALRSTITDLVDALESIAEPLAALRREAEADGLKLSGMAFQIANDPEHLKGIARDVLAKVRSQ